MAKGKIVKFNDSVGYGWIQPDKAGPNIFMHTDVLTTGEDVLPVGQLVEFEYADSPKGPLATTCATIKE